MCSTIQTRDFNTLPQKKIRGSGLIEVMIAVLIVSIGLIGLVRMQLGGLRNAESAYMQGQSSLVAYTILDALRADRVGATQGAYNMNKNCTTTPSASGLAGEVQRHWLQTLKNVLGDTAESCGEVACMGNLCTVRVFWNDSRAKTGADQASIELRTQL